MADRTVIAVGGGKGGVGKSFVSANLGVTIARSGKRVVLLDADLGGANLHTLFRILRPDMTVDDFIDGRVESLEDVALETSVPRLKLISGTCEVLGSADLAPAARRRLLEALATLDVDCLIIDVGAGTSAQTVDLFNAADTRLIVLTPELTSAQNAYGFLKVAVYRRFQQVLDRFPAAAALRAKLGDDAFKAASSLQKVESFFSLVGAEAPSLEHPLRLLLKEFNAKLVGNMLTRDADRNVLHALRRLISNFLDIQADVAAAFRSSSKVRASVNAGTPLAASRPSDYDTAEFDRLARACVQQDRAPLEALRTAISQALSEEGRVFAFGLDGIDVLEIEEVTDPAELAALAEIEREEAETERASTAPKPPPPPAPRPPPSPPPPPPAEAARRAEVDMDIEVDVEPEPEPRRPTPLPGAERPSARFVAELERVKRSSSRGEVYVEVRLGGYWVLGTLAHIELGAAIVKGVHPLSAAAGQQSAIRLVTMRADEQDELPHPARAVLLHYDEARGETALQLVDESEARGLLSAVLGPEALEPSLAAAT